MKIETIELGGIKYLVRQTDSPKKKWVQTDNGERIAIYSGGIWKFK